MTWQQRYRRMVEYYGWTNQDVAELTGNSEASIRTVTAPGSKTEFPRWARLALIIFEKEKNLKS